MRVVTVVDPATGERERFALSEFVMVGADPDDGVSEVSSGGGRRLDRALLASGVALHCAACPDPAAELAAVSRLAGRIADFEARVAGGAR